MESEPNESKPRDNWHYYAAVAALLAVLQWMLISWKPFEWWAWIPSIAAFVFAIVMYYHPDGWYRRMSASCLVLATGLFALPSVKLEAEWGEHHWLELIVDNSPGLALGLIFLVALFGYLDFRSRNKNSVAPNSLIEKSNAVSTDRSIAGSSIGGEVHIGDVGVNNEIHGKLQDRYFEALDEKAQLEKRVAQLEKEKAESARIAGNVEKADKIEAGAKSGDRRYLLCELIEEDTKAELFRVERKRNLADVAYLQGDIITAEKAIQAILEVNPNDLDAIKRIARIDSLRGNLADAESGYQRLLELCNEDKLWKSIAYGNLGLIYQTQGELALAEKMLNRSLEINQELGIEEGIAKQYGNLGLIHQTRGNLALAEKMQNQSLEINKKLGRKEGVAKQYGNLGVIYQTQGDLARAEEMHNQSLLIEKELGRKEGIAKQYSNLGVIYQTQGDLARAEEMHNQSLLIENELGRKEGIAADYGNLGLVYLARGDLARAEKMHEQSLLIEKELGRKEGIAIQHANLGLVYEMQDNLEKAKSFWLMSLKLYQEIGMPHIVEKVQGWLDELEKG